MPRNKKKKTCKDQFSATAMNWLFNYKSQLDYKRGVREVAKEFDVNRTTLSDMLQQHRKVGSSQMLTMTFAINCL